MACPFNPPSAEGKPPVPKWVPPEPTKTEQNWASLHTIDLSLLDDPNPKVVEDLVDLTKTAIKEDGFLYLVNYGISMEQLSRQFDLAQYLHDNISEEDKERLLFNPDTGVFAGFKRRLGWKREAGEFDGIEQFNFYAREFADQENRVPGCIKPFMDEIEAFAKVLELPDDYLWDNVQSHDGVVGDGYYRHALFHPLPETDRHRRKGVRIYGHTDYGTTTLLFSVPITALQIWRDSTSRWEPVKYSPGALLVNLGDSLEIISGGHLKATRHKVADTPADQQGLPRLSILQFNAAVGGLRLEPAMESPLIAREGVVLDRGVFRGYQALRDQGLAVPTSREWRELQIRSLERIQAPAEARVGGVKEVNGVKYAVDAFHGVTTMVPV